MTYAQAPSLSALEKKFGFKSLGISTIKLSTPGFSATGDKCCWRRVHYAT